MTVAMFPITSDTMDTNLEYMFEHILKATALCDELRSKGYAIGGYICIATLEGEPLFVCGIGERDEQKLGRYFQLCLEKASRLAKHPQCELSYLCRDSSQNRWGGAVRTERYIISFSGLPERLDEFYACLVGWSLEGGLTREEVDRLLALCDNPYRHEFDLDAFLETEEEKVEA